MARVPDHDDEEHDDAPSADMRLMWSDDAITRCRLCGWWIYAEQLADPVCAWCAAGRDPVPTPPHGTPLLWIELESLERPERP